MIVMDALPHSGGKASIPLSITAAQPCSKAVPLFILVQGYRQVDVCLWSTTKH